MTAARAGRGEPPNGVPPWAFAGARHDSRPGRHRRGRSDRGRSPGPVGAPAGAGDAAQHGAAAGDEAAHPARAGFAPALPLRQVLRAFWPYTRGLRRRLALGVLLAVAAIPLETLATLLFKVLVDRVLTPASFAVFPRLALAYLGLTVLTAVLSYGTGIVMTGVTETFLLNVRTSVMAHLNTLSPSFFQRHKLGDLLSRVGADVSAIETLVVSGVTVTVTAALQVLVFGGMLFVLDPLLALTAITVTPAFWLVSRFFARRLKDVSRESRRQLGLLSSIAEEGLSHVTLIQAYNGQRSLVERFHAEGGLLVRTAMRSARLRGVYRPLVDLVELTGLLLVVGVGTWELSHHRLTLGALLVFMAFFAQLYGPVRALGQLGTAAFTASAGAERLAEILTAQPDVTDDPRPWPGGRAEGIVGMSAVSFTYPGREQPALAGVTFVAAPGQLVAVVGRSGSGKSTLASLLLRWYDPDEGSVRLDGRDVRDRPLTDLRDQVALVMQETAMFDGTLRDNIRLGRPDADDAELRAAADAADVSSFAADLPFGLDTQVGQRGRLLSGGQRQRVAIARALLRDAPVLLLDEPTAGLDPAAEQRVLSAVDVARRGRTTVLITHNLLATRDAAQILVLDDGRVVDRGTHAELAGREGVFRELLEDQLRHAAAGDRRPPVVAQGGRRA